MIFYPIVFSADHRKETVQLYLTQDAAIEAAIVVATERITGGFEKQEFRERVALVIRDQITASKRLTEKDFHEYVTDPVDIPIPVSGRPFESVNCSHPYNTAAQVVILGSEAPIDIPRITRYFTVGKGLDLDEENPKDSLYADLPLLQVDLDEWEAHLKP